MKLRMLMSIRSILDQLWDRARHQTDTHTRMKVTDRTQMLIISAVRRAVLDQAEEEE